MVDLHAADGWNPGGVGSFRRFLATCSGLPLRLVWAKSSSCFSLIDFSIDFDAPLSLLFGVSPRLAESAATAAFCWAADLAAMNDLHRSLSFKRQRPRRVRLAKPARTKK